MEVRVLEYFLRVVELGSINRASAELHLSQPSLSRWLSLLEHELGTPLLVRTRQGILATDAGKELVARAQPILRQLNVLREEIGRKAHSQVALGMPFSMQRLVTGPFAAMVLRDHPYVTFRVYEGINNAIRLWMEQGLVDLSIMAFSERAPAMFEVTPLVREQLLLVGDRSAGLRPDAPVPVSRLAATPLILPGRPNVIRTEVENAMLRHGRKYRSRMEAETLSLCLELTRAGLGFTVMPSCALQGRGDDASLSAAPIRGLFLTWALHVNRTREHSATVRTIAKELTAFVRARIRAGGWPFAETVTATPRRPGRARKANADDLATTEPR